MKNRSHRYNINWPRFCLSIITAACIKQHLSNIWSSVYETVKQHTDWAEKSVAYKKNRVCQYMFNYYRIMLHRKLGPCILLQDKIVTVLIKFIWKTVKHFC